MFHKKGFSLTEFAVSLLIIGIAILVSLQAFISLNKDAKIVTLYLSSYLRGREAIDIMAKDCRIATRVMDSFGGYTTATNCLVLRVPSIDAGGNIIDIYNDFDYIIYRIVNKNLWKVVIPGSASSRTAHNDVLKKSIDSLYLTSLSVPLSSVPHKSVISNITIRISAVETFQGKEYRTTPGTTVKLMNYEWESVP